MGLSDSTAASPRDHAEPEPPPDHHRPARRFSPLGLLRGWVDHFTARGVYVPGEENRSLSPAGDFGWLITAWLISVALFIVFFAVAN
ncbi:MAG: hypothetical protein ACRDRL_21115 [Sciscionella sp.]